MYKIAFTTQFKKDFKKYLKKPQDAEKIKKVIELLSSNGFDSIPNKMKPHRLIGNYEGFLECHIKPDLLIIWEQYDEERKIYLTRLGSHAELF